MKNLNLIKRLWTDSHEKQSPQRFVRYAAMLIMLLTLGVGQMWADATNWKVKGTGTGLNGWDDKNTALTQGSTNTNVWYRQVSNTCEFKVVGSSGTWGDNEKNGNDHLESNNSINTAGVFNNGGNFRCTRSGTWYICYSTSSGKVYGTTANPDAPVTYTVTYNGNGKTSGSVPTDASSPYTSGSTVTVKGNTGSLVKTGCVFDGWMTAQDGTGTTYAPGATFSISGNTTLYARWIAKTIYVYDNLSWNTMKLYTFNSNRNGGWPGTVATSLGSKWYRIDILDGASQFIVNNKSGDSGSQSVDLNTSDYTAGRSYETYNDGGIKLREKKLTVSFNMKSHGSAVSSQNIYYNGLVTEPSPAPSATGYDFGGWYKETGCTNAWNFGSDRITAARTLYAKWTAKNYTITYNLNGGTQQVSPAPATSYTIESSAITLPTPSKDGCNFDGWFDNSSFTGSAITTIAAGSTGNKEYWAKWSTASTYYDVTFGVHASGHGTLAAVKTATSAAITSGDDLLSGTAITFTATPSSYYEVDAWYTNSACTTGEHDAGETTYSVASLGSDIVVYVKFKPTTYTITYNLNSGTNNPGNPSTYTYESSAITLQDPTRDGYTFGGWYTEVGLVNRVYSIAAGSNGNKAFWAKWTEKKSTVTVNANQTSMGTLKFGETSKSWGTTASVGVTTSQSIKATANSGYVFDRWVLSGGATTSSSLTSATITLKGNGTGADGIAKAVFGKKYYYRGGKNSWNATQMTRHESGYYAYYSASSGEHEFKITPNSDNYTDACNTFDNSYGNITLTHKDDGYGGLNVKCPGATAHYICILYPNTTVNDGANPVIFASTTLPDLAPETTYATTFYAGDHGAINAKGTAIAKNGNASVNIGSTARALTATPESGYSFDYWETSGSVTVADIYSASTTVTASAAGGTVTAHYLANSGWYLQGGFDNYDTWETSAKALPVDRPYRGISGVYYRPFSTLDNGDYFGMHDGTNKYSGHTATDKNYDYNSLDQVANLYVNSSQSFQAKTSFSNKWAVIKTTGTKKFWIQSPATYYTLSVTSANGTVTLTENNYGGLETNQFASGDRVNISVTASSGYWIDDITIGETSVATNVNASTYSGYTTMPSGAATLTVTYNRYYTLTYDANYYTSGTGGTAPSASSYVSGSNVTVVGKGDLTMTNYTFSGWNTDPHITGTNYAEGANIEMTGNITLYGVWKRTIPFELEDADPEFVMATVYGTYNCTTLTDYDNPTKDGYTFGGWWTNIAGGDNYVISPEKELQPGVYHWTNYDNKTNEFMRKPSSESSLFAKWTQTVTLNANLANHGSGTDKSASVTYKKNALTSITHCTPAAGYELAGYYTAATGGTKILNANGTYAGTNVSDNEEAYIVGGVWKHAGATILYAQYSEIMRTVAVSVNNAYLGTVSTASLTDVGPATASAEVTATPTPGATLTNWTLPSGVTAAATYSATSNPISVNATAAGKTITANFTETMHTVTLSTADGSKGTVGSNQSVGQITAVQITATPKSGYMFSKWVKTAGSGTVTYYTGAGNGQVEDASGEEKETTYITVTGNVTLQATWEADRSSGYVVHYGNSGKNADGGTDASQTRPWKDGKLYRATTEASDISYFTFTAGVGDVDKVIEFKIWETSSNNWDHWYGYNSNDGGKIDGNISNVTLNTSYGNGRLCITMPGSYLFTWDKSTNKLSIRYPNDVYYVRGGFNSWDWSHPMTETSSGVYSATVNMTEANHTYSGDNGFKLLIAGQYYGKDGTTVTRSTSTGSAAIGSCSTSGANIGITTDYTGNYTFTYTVASNTLQVTYPTAYKVTYGKGSVDGSASNCSAVDIDNSSAAVTSNSTWVKSGNRVVLTAPAAKSGYRYLGWYDNNSATGDAITTNANCTITVSSALTRYACYAENLSAITITTDGHGTITTPSPNSSPYNLGVTTTQAINASANTGYSWSTWTTSGNAALGTTATTASNTAKGNGTNGGTGTITATFTPNNYDVVLDVNGATTGSDQTVTATFDATMPTTQKGGSTPISAPSKTGYNFDGYTKNNNGTGTKYYTSALANNHVWDIATNNTHIYAKWDAKQSTLSFDYQTSATGYGTSGTVSAGSKATYDAEMPTLSGTLPTAANGYAFMGFYSATGGSGTKYYNADGTSANNWAEDTESTTTLYAYYQQAEITALAFDALNVDAGGTVGVTPTIDPTPVGDKIICWTILHDNDSPLDPQPEKTWDGTKLTFTAPAYSGTYKVQAVLRTGLSCGGGTELDTRTESFTVAGTHTVTVNYKCGDDVIKTATSETATPLDWSGDITAPDIFGYTFTRWDAADGVTIKNGEFTPVTTSTDATIKIKATYNGKLTAVYTQKSMIYFKNTLGWSNVYVNFYESSYWNNPNGSGNQSVAKRNLAMTRYGETDIWYYDYGAASITPGLYVSFTSESQDNTQYFWKSGGVNVVYPANYADDIHTDKSSENGFKAATPMFVPLATQEKVTLNQSSGGKADYYNAGYWTKYTPGTGYRLEIYNNSTGAFIKAQDFTSADELMPMKAVLDLEGGTTYKFQLRRGGESSAGIYYGNTGTMTYSNHGQGTPWAMTNTMTGDFQMAKITTNTAGGYTFHLSYSPNASDEYRLRIAVDYPISTGDYRLLYSDAVQTKPLTSAIVTKENDGSDIVSFFVRPGSTPVLRIQQATVANDGKVTWKEYPTDGTPTNQITGTIATTITSGGKEVYNFNLSMDGEGALSVASVEKYTGNFYIRTDAANSKWDNYKTDPDHLMTYSEYSIEHGGYTHYYCHWVKSSETGRKNVKFVIANDYSPNISDTLARETASGTWENIASFMEEGGDLKRDANVRFMWDKRDNTISRAYVDGAQGDYSANFLYMLNVEAGADKIRKSDESALTDHKVTFKDNGNWMYEANIQAQPDAKIKLLSNWGTSNTITQYFRGASDATETLIGGSGSNWYDIRLIYDFKTNRLIAGLIPSGTIDEQMAIHADVMFIREHQDDIAQLTFAEKDSKMGAITDIETAFGVLRFNKWTINNKSKADGHAPLVPALSRYERDLFYVSFPFRVAMEDVFGFGTYGQHWIIEYYDGASRAANGYWLESGPNWKFVTNRKGKYFEPGQGYIIALDLDELGESSSVWANTDQVELYFPSYGTMPNITSSTATYEIPSHKCTINRTVQADGVTPTGLPAEYDRRVRDSHWNVLGVPTYVNPAAPSYANTDWETEFGGPNFLYQVSWTDNSVSPVSSSTFTYHAMHAYLVQYCGNVTWTASVSPSLAPRRNPEYRGNFEFRLEMLQNDKAVDRAFVKLSDDEHVTTGFEFNYDMSKEFNSKKANIYTLIGSEPVAGNVLPLTEQTTVVPVGVKIAANGDYTFSMPDGTEGTGITLIDNETGIRTPLGALDYTINLSAGTYDNRFVLEIAPIKQMPTDIELLNGETGENGVRKVMIDGILYIVKGGKMFDATGRRVE